MEILRLHLGAVTVTERAWPVHGFVILHPGLGPVLVDTGCGGPEAMLREWGTVNRSVADALADHGLSPADVRVVVNTHLHFDHCGQNAVFTHAPFWVQRRELERARRDEPELSAWFDVAGARFELLDGDAVLGDGLRILATPGHTSGHQCVLVDQPDGVDLLIGDAAYTSRVWRAPDPARIPRGQAEDVDAWARSLASLRALGPRRIHFCHDAAGDAAAPAAPPAT